MLDGSAAASADAAAQPGADAGAGAADAAPPPAADAGPSRDASSEVGPDAALLPAELAAFPGCQGAGCETRGGFDGRAGTPRLFRVTELDPGTGAGTLGECIAASGPRVCTFAVSGKIHAPSGGYSILNPFITIRGDSAPGKGVTLDFEATTDAVGAVLNVRTHDVVVRGLRARDGHPESDVAAVGESHAFLMYPRLDVGEAYRTNHVVIDHVSFSWGHDETFGIQGRGGAPDENQPHDLTISNVIVAEGMKRTESAAGYSFGMLITGHSATTHAIADAMTDIDIHHSFFGNSSKRNPEVHVARTRFVNNVIYNWGTMALAYNDGVQADVIDNVGRRGPNTDDYSYPELIGGLGYYYPGDFCATGPASFFIEGNKYYGEQVQGWGTPLVRVSSGAPPGEPVHRTAPMPAAASGPAIQPEPADALEVTVIGAGGAGHSRRLDCGGAWVTAGVRDSVDQRLMDSFSTPPPYFAFVGCTAADCWPLSPADVGGHPAIPEISIACPATSRENASCVCADSDADGMPDYWERYWCSAASGADSCSAFGSTIAHPWTNLEAFLSGVVIAR